MQHGRLAGETVVLSALDYYDEEIQAAEQPWTEGHKRGVGHRQLPEAPSGQGVLADLLIPATQAAYEANERAIAAMLRSLRIFNALTQYRDEHGREASGLEELSLPKEATIDPFSGEPLKLKHTDDGWIIYSVMTNGVDDGGRLQGPQRLRRRAAEMAGSGVT